MQKRILKTLTNNFWYKVLALLFAVILWLVVYNVDDPVITRTYMATVALQNEDTIQDKYYEILENSHNVTFTVSGKRSVLDKVDDTDFTATADFNEMVVSEDGARGNIKINIAAKKSASLLKINGSGKTLLVSLEDAKTKPFVVNPTTEGEVAEGYALGDVSISSSNVIKVSGPASVVSQISKAVAAINVEGMSQTVSDSVVPVFYDEDGNEVDTTKLTLSRTTVTVSAVILGTKKVSLALSTKGTPADGYALAGIEASATTVWIKGSTSVLNPISTVEIPASVLDISNASESFETTINITDYLPSGVSLLNTADATITVTVDIEAYETRTFEIPVGNITIEGLSVENTLTYPLDAVYVNITGLAVDLNALDAQTLRGTIDVTDMTLGSHVVNVDVDVDTTKFVVASSRTQVYIEEKPVADDNTNGTNPDATDDPNAAGDANAGTDDTTTDTNDGTSDTEPSDGGADDTTADSAESTSYTGRRGW